MAAPAKPWEHSGNLRVFPATVVSNGSGLQSAAPPIGIPQPRQGRTVRSTPPLPARAPQMSHLQQGFPTSGASYYPSYQSYGSYGGGYGNAYGAYSGYGGGYNSSFGGYGGYGMNRFGGFPSANGPESRFIQMAEEGSRPAFQSIESLVHAVGSVSFMLESTFNAMYSSFRAVLGVAENFGRLRSLFGQFFSVFAVFRTLHWLYKKCLYLLGLSQMDPGPGREALWSQAASGQNAGKPRSSWPVLVFLSILFSGPYLMWKLLNSLNISTVDSHNPSEWNKCKDPVLAAVVLYDFVGTSDQDLTVQTNQQIIIAPRECQLQKNWLLASPDGKRVGFVPSNYIRIAGRVEIKTKTPLEVIPTPNQPSSDLPLIDSQVSVPEPTVPQEAQSQSAGDTHDKGSSFVQPK